MAKAKPLIYLEMLKIVTIISIIFILSCSSEITNDSDSNDFDYLRSMKNKTKKSPSEISTYKFHFESSSAAFVIIDMQNFSCSSTNGGLPEIEKVITRINQFVAFCRIKKIPIIWVRQNINIDQDQTDGGLFSLFHSKSHLKQMTNLGEGTEIYQGMDFDSIQDHLVFKNRYSAFLSTPPELQNKLKSLHRTQLIIAGVAANVCVESTIRDAMQLDYEVTLLSDGTTATSNHLLESTLQNIQLFFGDVRSVDELIKEIETND
ncbi:MAG: hypothetical protein DRI84_00775 [Bacteroidetes bacterium]|nr:MAG: hypothetical protein DRI84_00775 [Bacteroidota bacterium]